MKKTVSTIKFTYQFAYVVLLSFLSQTAYSQNIYDKRQSVILQNTVQENPPAIKLEWVLDTANGGYTIWRKLMYNSTWTDSLITLDPSTTSWTDTSVSIGTGYEYQVLKSLPAFPFPNGTKNTGAGYICAGINLPAKHHRGSLLLVIDSTFKQSLDVEIAQLLSDTEADGWMVKAHYVDRKDSVQLVKLAIKKWAASYPDSNQSVFLLGRVPVPYSGEIAPDGHHNDHRGAWPCDGYYGNLDGIWTDATVNINGPGSRHDNKPGDGKFDQNVVPSPTQLQIGRVDFANMDKFPESEEQLLRRYLSKDHAWRMGKLSVLERGLIDNNFAPDPEALGQTAWRNFAPMFGISNVKDLQYRQTLTNQSYLWSYGCGGGGPESASDISNTTNFTTDSLQTLFTILFGSYFGDWDFPNNFLRAAIASRTCLASTWGNRPNWYFHHMALGEHIGYSTKITMNIKGKYIQDYYGGWVHTALMGDPTLRMHIHPPVENLIASQNGIHINLEWQDPANSEGYFVYRKIDGDSIFRLLNQIPVTNTFYTDPCPGPGFITYMVRGMGLRMSASGTYYNLSTGIKASIISNPVPYISQAQIKMPDQGLSNGSISLDPEGGCNPYSYEWNNGSTTSGIQNLSPGQYCVTITDCLGCTLVDCPIVEQSSRLDVISDLLVYRLYPNPVDDNLNLELEFKYIQDVQMDLIDTRGLSLSTRNAYAKKIQQSWNVEFLSPGYYGLRIKTSSGTVYLPFIKTNR